MNHIRLILSLFALLLLMNRCNQKPVFRVEDGEMILRLERSWNKQTTDSILALFDMSKLAVDTAWRFGSAGQLAKDGWLVRKTGKDHLEVYKSTTNEHHIDLIGIPLGLETPGYTIDSNYVALLNGFNDQIFGTNNFKENSVYALNDSVTVFRLEGFKNARRVILSGSFNNWATQNPEMKRDDTGWVISLKLPDGRHEYKFIVDGNWMQDPSNNQRTPDNAGDYNSVYFKTNFTFRLNGYEEARNAIVAGSFNDWNEKELEMQRIGDSWVLDVFLPDGTYGYKFIVDNNWITDPANADIRPDGNGNLNSFVSLGDPVSIQLHGNLKAREVYVTGTFGQTGLALRRTDSLWTVPLVLKPGVYDYQFLMDGNRTIDAKAPLRLDLPSNELVNFIVIEPNHTFMLQGFQDAKSVMVTGSFCDWNEGGYPMKRQNDTWILPFYLSPGKIKYKYIVDGNWILDPGNPDWEENEFGTGNSIVWKRD